MNSLKLKMIPFISGQSCITSGISGYTFIGPDGGKIEAYGFRLVKESVNISWCPLKPNVDLDVNRSLLNISLIFRHFLSKICTSYFILNPLSICIHVPQTCSLDSEVQRLGCDISLIGTRNRTATVSIVVFLLFVIIVLPEV